MAYTIPRKYFEKPTRPAPKGAAVNWEQVRKDMGLPEPPEELRNGGAGASPLASAILDPTAPVDVVAVVGGPRNVPGGLGPVKSPDREITGACNAIRLQVEKKVGRTFEQYEVLGYKSQVVNGLNHFVKILTNSTDGRCIHVRLYYRSGRYLLTAVLDGEDRGSPLEYFDASTNPAELPPSYNEAVSSESEGNIQHEVTPDDTINSLAIRYGASADAIRTANGLHGRNLQERKTVIIPASGVTRAAPQRSTVEQFMAVTGCTNRDEARSYLARCEGDANEAIRLYSEEISVENELLRVNAARVDADRQSVASGAGLLRGGKDKSKKKFLGIF